jgi:hypothetical protein
MVGTGKVPFEAKQQYKLWLLHFYQAQVRVEAG